MRLRPFYILSLRLPAQGGYIFVRPGGRRPRAVRKFCPQGEANIDYKVAIHWRALTGCTGQLEQKVHPNGCNIRRPTIEKITSDDSMRKTSNGKLPKSNWQVKYVSIN